MRQLFLRFANRLIRQDQEAYQARVTETKRRLEKRMRSPLRPFILSDAWIVLQLLFLIGVATLCMIHTTTQIPLWPLWTVIITCSGLIVFYLGVIWFSWRKAMKDRTTYIHSLIDTL